MESTAATTGAQADAEGRGEYGGCGTRCLVEGKQRVEAGRAAELQLGLASRGERAIATATARAGQAGSAPAGAARDHDILIRD